MTGKAHNRGGLWQCDRCGSFDVEVELATWAHGNLDGIDCGEGMLLDGRWCNDCEETVTATFGAVEIDAEVEGKLDRIEVEHNWTRERRLEVAARKVLAGWDSGQMAGPIRALRALLPEEG